MLVVNRLRNVSPSSIWRRLARSAQAMAGGVAVLLILVVLLVG
jgi:hypothetical protein